MPHILASFSYTYQCTGEEGFADDEDEKVRKSECSDANEASGLGRGAAAAKSWRAYINHQALT